MFLLSSLGYGLPDDIVIEKRGKGDTFVDCTGADIKISSIKFVQHDAVEGILSKYLNISFIIFSRLWRKLYFPWKREFNEIPLLSSMKSWLIMYIARQLRKLTLKWKIVQCILENFIFVSEWSFFSTRTFQYVVCVLCIWFSLGLKPAIFTLW